jgi:hypothetical protein
MLVTKANIPYTKVAINKQIDKDLIKININKTPDPKKSNV